MTKHPAQQLQELDKRNQRMKKGNISYKDVRGILPKQSKYRNKPVWRCEDCRTDYDGNVSRSFVSKSGHCEMCGAKLLRFDSKKELKRWHELKQLEKEGQIRNLQRQVPFTFPIISRAQGFADLNHLIYDDLKTEKGRDLKYVADFVYQEKTTMSTGPTVDGMAYQVRWDQVVEDTKGFRTERYKLMKELMRVVNGIDVRET